jgi:HTH-type transcriptional regulator / antitoxin HigA
MAEMGLKKVDHEKYGALCADAVPKVIENDAEFDRMVKKLEELTFKKNPSREERILADLLQKLIQDYNDQHYTMPRAKPHEAVQFLIEQKGLKQTDLVAVIGSRAQVSDLVNGKRGISKVQARKLADFFGVSVELFI